MAGGGVQRGRLSEYEHHRKRRKETDLPHPPQHFVPGIVLFNPHDNP